MVKNLLTFRSITPWPVPIEKLVCENDIKHTVEKKLLFNKNIVLHASKNEITTRL